MKRLAVTMMALTLVLAACQSAGEQVSERLIEQIDGVDSVDFDADSGEISIETDEGSFTVGGGELPDEFSVSLPDGYDILGVFETDDGSSVTLVYGGDRFEELAAHFDSWTGGQPGEWSSSNSSFETNGQTQRISSWNTESMSISIADCVDPNGDGADTNAVCTTILDF